VSDRLQIWSSGGGTQSAAIAVLILQGRLPRPDYGVIADTGREKKTTWEYLEQVVNPALKKTQGWEIERLRCADEPAIFNGKGTLLLPIFYTGGAKLSNFCSAYWKRDRVKKWALDNSLTPATNWIGFSTNEMERVSTPRAANWLLDYPLIYKVPMSRMDCVNLVREHGWPKPPRSHCWMCPNTPDSGWVALREKSPEEFTQAVEFEREMQKVKPDAFLHKSLTPLDQVEFKEKDDTQGTFGCNSGDCFV
jgi:hypothetical protein